MPCPFLLSKSVCCTCLVIFFKINRKVRAMTHNKYIYRCVAKCFIYGQFFLYCLEVCIIVCHSTAYFLFKLYIMYVIIILILNKDLVVINLIVVLNKDLKVLEIVIKCFWLIV